jgi:hypothetical protein
MPKFRSVGRKMATDNDENDIQNEKSLRNKPEANFTI